MEALLGGSRVRLLSNALQASSTVPTPTLSNPSNQLWFKPDASITRLNSSWSSSGEHNSLLQGKAQAEVAMAAAARRTSGLGRHGRMRKNMATWGGGADAERAEGKSLMEYYTEFSPEPARNGSRAEAHPLFQVWNKKMNQAPRQDFLLKENTSHVP